MTQPWQSPIFAVTLLLLSSSLAACGNCGAGNGDGDGGQTDAGDAEIVDVEFGIETRPVNTTCIAPARPASGARLALDPVYQNLPAFAAPVLARQAPDDGSRWFVVEQAGRVLVFDDNEDVSTTRVFIDISGRVNDGPAEAGLLGLAFHPDFATNGQVFLSYTAADGPTGLQSRVSRFVSTDTGVTLDPGSEEILFREAQPYGNHNGGHIAFGPDGFLYLGLGDGGSGGDPDGNGQDPSTRLGAILRLDVDGGTPYAIPPDNPFADGIGGAKEIYAWGLRNPWRFSFDRGTGTLWVGDVGQGEIEEVDRITRPGGNYGWNTMEGTTCYNAGACDDTGLVLPVVEYTHSVGQSITGGYVYRGTAIDELRGVYLYADFVSGRVWGLFDGTPDVLLDSGVLISSFAEDADGELYLIDYGAGRMLRLVRVGPVTAPTFPQTLAETGCVDRSDPTVMAPGVIPYDLRAPLWSDNATKRRWLALPDGRAVVVGADGDWELPIGSVLIKEFSVAGQRIETRLLVRHDDGDWAGYTYAWNDTETGARLLPAGKTVTLPTQDYSIPDRAQCLQCHTQAAGRSLGRETAQLNRLFVYPGGRRANQLTTLSHLGIVPLTAAAETLPKLPEYDGDASAEDRARAYLHANCAYCHRPQGGGPGNMDLRFDQPAATNEVCNALPLEGDLGLTDARVVAPGNVSRSVLSARMHATDINRMPPVATHIVDPVGTDLVDTWITGLTGCP